MKGRLPEGVDFAAYPGRSSTPLPTAESKGAERINQLKIWNEAATNDDKRGLRAAQGKQALTATGSGSRRTDSFKDAKERHSASFQGSDDSGQATANNAVHTKTSNKADIFADRSDDDSEEEEDVRNRSDRKLKDPDSSAEVDQPVEAVAPLQQHATKQDINKAANTDPVKAAPGLAAESEGAHTKDKRACCSIQ